MSISNSNKLVCAICHTSSMIFEGRTCWHCGGWTKKQPQYKILGQHKGENKMSGEKSGSDTSGIKARPEGEGLFAYGPKDNPDENKIEALEEKVAYLEKAIEVLMRHLLYGKELISTDRRKDLRVSIALDVLQGSYKFAERKKAIERFVKGELMIDKSSEKSRLSEENENKTRIIEQGKVPESPEIEAKCEYCKTKFAFFLSDARIAQNLGWGQAPTIFAIDCPLCKQAVIHERDDTTGAKKTGPDFEGQELVSGRGGVNIK